MIRINLSLSPRERLRRRGARFRLTIGVSLILALVLSAVGIAWGVPRPVMAVLYLTLAIRALYDRQGIHQAEASSPLPRIVFGVGLVLFAVDYMVVVTSAWRPWLDATAPVTLLLAMALRAISARERNRSGGWNQMG